MEVFSPLITMVLNIVAAFLVSKGILDTHSQLMFVQVGDNIIAAMVTVLLGGYSIYKMVDLKKHQISHAPSVQQSSTIIPEHVTNQPAVAEATASTGDTTPATTATTAQ